MKNLILILCLVFSGCSSSPIIRSSDDASDLLKQGTQQVEKSTKSIESSVDIIDDQLNTIDNSTDNIEGTASDLPESPNKESILNDADSISDAAGIIRDETRNIDGSAEDLNDAVSSLKAGTNETEKLELKVAELESRNREIQRKAIANLYRVIGIIVILGIGLLIAGGIALFWTRKIGMALIAVGVLTIAIGSALIFYLQWVALIGIITLGVVFIASLVGFGYMAIRGKNLEIANKENVELLEIAKQKLDPDETAEIFGDKALPGIAHTIQSETTKKLVQVERLRLKSKIAPTINLDSE